MSVMFRSATAKIAAIAFTTLVFSGPAFAAGETDTSTTTTETPAPKCKEGQVWDPTASTFFGKGKCVVAAEIKKPAPEKQSMIYDYGKSLAKSGEYALAIEVLAMAPDQSDARVLNYLGYSNRKLGKMDEALGYYQAAIAQNPDFSLVREYLGEAYIQLGQLEQARGQLSQIERICGGRTCGEYGQLAKLIVESQSAN